MPFVECEETVERRLKGKLCDTLRALCLTRAGVCCRLLVEKAEQAVRLMKADRHSGLITLERTSTGGAHTALRQVTLGSW